MSDDDGVGYGLVMPFVVCGEDGPYEDQSFVAGAQMQQIDSELERGEVQSRYVLSPLVPQIDLVAMRHGYAMQATPWDEHPDEWTLVEFTRQPLPTTDGGT